MKTNFKLILFLLLGFCLFACQNEEKDELLDNFNDSNESAFLRASASDPLSDFAGVWTYIRLAQRNASNCYLSANQKNNTVDLYKYNNDLQIWKFDKERTSLNAYVLTTKNTSGDKIALTGTNSNDAGFPILTKGAIGGIGLMFEPIQGTNWYRIYYNNDFYSYPNYNAKKAYLTAKSNTSNELYFTTDSKLGDLQCWSISIAEGLALLDINYSIDRSVDYVKLVPVKTTILKFTNPTSGQINSTQKYITSYSTASSFTSSYGIDFSTSQKVGIPEISSESTITGKTAANWTYGVTESNSETRELSLQFSMAPYQNANVKITEYKYDANISYTAKFNALTSLTPITIQGKWKGSSISEIHYEIQDASTGVTLRRGKLSNGTTKI